MMNTYSCLALVFGFSSIFGFSMLTDDELQNATYSEKSVSKHKNTNVFQQLLNQETIIRMSMVKNIHVLLKDMLILKQSLLSAESDISTLKQTTVELKKELHHLKRENERLSKENEGCKENISAIHNTEKKTSNILGDMKIEVRYLSVTLLNLNEKVKTDNENIPKLNVDSLNKSLVDYQTNLTATADEMSKTVNKLRNEVKESKFEQLKLSSAVSSLEVFRMNFSKNACESFAKVAFTAGMTSADNTFSGGTLMFPAVITNIGGGYNPSTGIFTTPNDGLYVFYVSGLEYHTQYLRLDIVLNGVSKVRLIGESAAAYQTGTNMAVLNLQQGDRVWVKRTYGKGYWSDIVPVTTFSGFQI